MKVKASKTLEYYYQPYKFTKKTCLISFIFYYILVIEIYKVYHKYNYFYIIIKALYTYYINNNILVY